MIPGRAASSAAPVGAIQVQPAEPVHPAIARFSVVDINMPFASIVGFMVKWALAAIPALLIVSAVVFVLVIVLAGWPNGAADE